MEDGGGSWQVAVLISSFLGVFILLAARSSGMLRGRRELSPAHRAILRKYAIHYQRIGRSEQLAFERIVSVFLNDKEWRGARTFITVKMKVMISACAAQLLLGFPEVVLQHFERIVVYPDKYRSPRSGRMHMGEVRPSSGVIVISWDDFVHRYAHSRDAHNVGLHEMAHALWFENSIQNGEQNFLQPELLQAWMEGANAEIARIKKNESRLFRDYAGTNQAEFFAVAIEYFFEQPALFLRDLPELYATLSAMLRQDPAKGTVRITPA